LQDSRISRIFGGATSHPENPKIQRILIQTGSTLLCDRFGPNHLSLVACQVTRNFEAVLIRNLTRHAAGAGSQQPAPTQRAQGLGAGCKPLSEAKTFTTPNGRLLRTRRQYQRLPGGEQERILNELQGFNRRHGYYGAPPVPEDHVLDYFFDEAPAASWVIVTVGASQPDGSLRDTQIPFWNRSTGPDAARFRQICDQGAGMLRPRRPAAPPVP
jgi:hypothetical protein